MDYDTPSFLFLHILFIGFFSSDYAELSEHSCSHGLLTNFHRFGLAAIA